MPNTMLIDAAHPEETRVVVMRGNKVEEFDFEAADKRQLRGNIYLAKVTRVEPSLQAAFIEYGGNRHGFLAFSEIHPDYYQIPVADREALVAQDKAEEEAEPDEAPPAANGADGEGDEGDQEGVESVGAEDGLEEAAERRKPRMRSYKIQEVIKRRQVLLVQVVKEERGNKGAALTTYLSLAGRYSVLMPNTARGGGISRKITDAADRKRLKTIASELDVPEGMGLILRTAGANRTKAEIKRDFEYLLRLWIQVRDLTLKSTAPRLVYEEGSLIKRSIRDLYSKEIGQVLVSGDDGYREAKEFMRMLTPSHAKNVKPYKDEIPLFNRYGIEPQLDAMFSPTVNLKSGGYVVINQTEALVAIDVNSGRSTREHSIEETAHQTNLEAAEEVARQLRLRDLAGLIVIDFIDMDEKRNNRAVEKRMKDALKADRARIQVGRISHFGLLEMSRQRLRTGVVESTTAPCPACHGTGQVRSMASVALQLLRALEDHLLRDATRHLEVRTRTDVALYVLNSKRGNLAEIEKRFGLEISILADEDLESTDNFRIGKGGAVENPVDVAKPAALPEPVADDEETIEADAEAERDASADERPRRRRRRSRRNSDENEAKESQAAEPEASEGDTPSLQKAEGEGDDDQEGGRKRRRRGRRGGRRRNRGGADASADGADGANGDDAQTSPGPSGADTAEQAEVLASSEQETESAGDPASVSSGDASPPPDARNGTDGHQAVETASTAHSSDAVAPEDREAEGASIERSLHDVNEIEAVLQPGEDGSSSADEAEADVAAAANDDDEPDIHAAEDTKPRRRGWWQRRSFLG